MSDRCPTCGHEVDQPVLVPLDDCQSFTFARESETSRQAAYDVWPRQGSQREKVLLSLAEAPATRDELVIRLRLRGNTVRPRVRELVLGGWVYESDETRKTATGSDAAVLRLTSNAMLHVGEVAA